MKQKQDLEVTVHDQKLVGKTRAVIGRISATDGDDYNTYIEKQKLKQFPEYIVFKCKFYHAKSSSGGSLENCNIRFIGKLVDGEVYRCSLEHLLCM